MSTPDQNCNRYYCIKNLKVNQKKNWLTNRKIPLLLNMVKKVSEEHERLLEDARIEFLRLRGVETPCERCKGMGTRLYSSGATWRTGMSTRKFTYDLCDECWGTGDDNKHSLDLKILEKRLREKDHNECVSWLASYLGLGFPIMKERILMLADLADEQSKKFPPSYERFSWFLSWESLALLLRNLVVEEKD